MKRTLLLLIAASFFAPAAWGKPQKSAKPRPPEKIEEPLSLSTAAPRSVPELIAHFQEIDRRLTSLSARFSQSLTMADAGMAQRVEGTLEYAKPNHLRVEHSKPQRQVFVSDGSKIWVHRVDQNQVIQSSLSDWKRSDPLFNNLLDFGNYAKMLETYDVAFDTAAMKATLTPKGKAEQPFALRLILAGKNLFPMHTELDVGSTKIRTALEDVRFNAKIPEARFRFAVPPGADVFDNFKPPMRSEEPKK